MQRQRRQRTRRANLRTIHAGLAAKAGVRPVIILEVSDFRLKQFPHLLTKGVSHVDYARRADIHARITPRARGCEGLRVFRARWQDHPSPSIAGGECKLSGQDGNGQAYERAQYNLPAGPIESLRRADRAKRTAEIKKVPKRAQVRAPDQRLKHAQN